MSRQLYTTLLDPLQPFHVHFQLAPSRLNEFCFLFAPLLSTLIYRYKNLNNTVATRGKVLHAAVHSLQSFDKSLDQVSMARENYGNEKHTKRAEISSHEMWEMLKAFSLALLSCLNQITLSLKSFRFLEVPRMAERSGIAERDGRSFGKNFIPTIPFLSSKTLRRNFPPNFSRLVLMKRKFLSRFYFLFAFYSQTSEGGEIESKALMNLKVSRETALQMFVEKRWKSLRVSVFHRKMAPQSG